MPEYLPVRRIECQQIARRIAREKQLAGSRQNAREGVAEPAAGILVLPRHVAGLVIDRRQNRLRHSAASTTPVTLRLRIGVGQISYAVTLLGIHIEQSRIGTKARWWPVSRTAA